MSVCWDMCVALRTSALVGSLLPFRDKIPRALLYIRVIQAEHFKHLSSPQLLVTSALDIKTLKILTPKQFSWSIHVLYPNPMGNTSKLSFFSRAVVYQTLFLQHHKAYNQLFWDLKSTKLWGSLQALKPSDERLKILSLTSHLEPHYLSVSWPYKQTVSAAVSNHLLCGEANRPTQRQSRRHCHSATHTPTTMNTWGDIV